MEKVKENQGGLTVPSKIETEKWGSADGRDVYLFKVVNRHGMSMTFCNYGAIVKSILVPDNLGNFRNVVLSYNTLEEYINDQFYIGAIAGRYAGRIADAAFNIEGIKYEVTKSAGGFHHHGGKKGFNKMVWSAEPVESIDGCGVTFKYVSKDGEEGFPGNLEVTLTYTLNDHNEWTVHVSAITDKTTVLNLTQHTYFNLSGVDGSTAMQHNLQLHTKWYLPVNEKILPTGDISEVTGTPFDFLSLRPIGERINDQHQQMLYGCGYDHTWVLKTANDHSLKMASTLVDPASCRCLEIYTTEPSVHFYSGNFLSDPANNRLAAHTAICLETQHFGNSPNVPAFPSTVLRPGELFESKTVFRFKLK